MKKKLFMLMKWIMINQNKLLKLKGNIRIENLDENIEIFGDELTYFKNEEKIILNKNVKINFEKKIFHLILKKLFMIK